MVVNGEIVLAEQAVATNSLHLLTSDASSPNLSSIVWHRSRKLWENRPLADDQKVGLLILPIFLDHHQRVRQFDHPLGSSVCCFGCGLKLTQLPSPRDLAVRRRGFPSCSVLPDQAFFFHVRLTQNAVQLQKRSCELHVCALRSVPSDMRIIPKGYDESGFSTDNNFAF